jgi:WD40 repeat protein
VPGEANTRGPEEYPFTGADERPLIRINEVHPVGPGEGHIEIWNIQRQIKVGLLKGHTQKVFSLEFNRQVQSLVSVSQDEVRVWHVSQ